MVKVHYEITSNSGHSFPDKFNSYEEAKQYYSKTPEDIDEGLKHLNLVDRRLDYIDNNLLTIAEAIKCQKRKD